MTKPRRQCRMCRRQRTWVDLRSKVCSSCYGDWQEKVAKQKKRQSQMNTCFSLLAERFGENCMICGSEPRKRRMNVDHDHAEGPVRGLLCYYCNIGLSFFKDNPERLRLAADYVESPPALGMIELTTPL